MSDLPATGTQSEEDNGAQAFFVGAGVGIVVLTIALIVLAVFLALNAASTGPVVEVIRDLLLATMALELLVIGASIVVFLVQVARFVNLLNNEIEPIIASTQDTVNVVRGTAIFVSKHAVEPIVAVAAGVKGLGDVLSDVDAISKAAGIGASIMSAVSPTGARSTTDGQPQPESSPGPAPARSTSINPNPGSPEDASKQAGY